MDGPRQDYQEHNTSITSQKRMALRIAPRNSLYNDPHK